MKRVSSAGAAAALLLSCSVADAHHSFAMFDLGKDVTVEAVVKEVQFTNPHVWLQILVADEKGGQTGMEHRVRGTGNDASQRMEALDAEAR